MKPYRSGNYVVGNCFLMDLNSGRVSTHSRQSMQQLASLFPPDPAAGHSPVLGSAPEPVPAIPALELSEAQRLAVFAPGIEKALARPMPAPDYHHAREDLSLESGPAAPTRVTVTITVERFPETPPARPSRPWTDNDEELYQVAKMWECAVFHWSEPGA